MPRTSAKYWHVAEAVAALGNASVADTKEWLSNRYPDEDLADVRENLEHLTVNSPSRPHYDKVRTNWRSDSDHPRDLLIKFHGDGSRQVSYELFTPANHGHFDLRRKSRSKTAWEVVPLTVSEQMCIEAEAQARAFGPAPSFTNDHDARVWNMRAVAERRGQPIFRRRLLDVYEGRCAISGCNASAVLEAAHIQPFRGDHTNGIDNGLLLRADLHTLFDCHLLWVTSESKVRLAPELLSTEYSRFEGKALELPRRREDGPNPKHLAAHAKRCADRQSDT